MGLKIIGAGIPRTGTRSLEKALKHLLGGRIYTMSSIPGHPFNLGDDWNMALKGQSPDWDKVFNEFVATVSFPGALFWRELTEAYPDALVVLSVRDTDEWWHSIDETLLRFDRDVIPSLTDGRGIVDLYERFAGTANYDGPEIMKAAYERHNDTVRQNVSSNRLLEWQPTEGWAPICQALDLPVPNIPFPWVNRRAEWTRNIYGSTNM
ncbi:sulfotransferase family protein [Alicyclobacillus fodiniaquatilis]|uniref:Sulfotransferase family protein n=1 Tax=Alicyclobacillus fodiniaquatilis TaxID=1661150 RepID=A0ABW4JFI4_9BACL